MRQPFGSAALLLAFAFNFLASVYAQTQGEITGQVTDSSGAVMVGVKVTVTNVATGVSRPVSTNDAGVYGFPSLVPGVYSVKAEMNGFRPVVHSEIGLQVQQTARIDFALEVGQVTEAVQVIGGAPLLTTESATTGTVIENRRIVELPLDGRNFLQLVGLSSNVTVGFATVGIAGGRQGGPRTEQTVSVAGQRSEYNNFTLDGVLNTDPNFNTYVVLPSIDALQEFKVQTGVYPAEFGRATSQINVSTKPGTNSFHGALFEFLRNSKLDATSYAFTAKRPLKEPFKRNQYGFTLGGPVWIPKVFSGKNRLFFMANYEGLRDRKDLRQVASVPSAEMRRGDFSSLLPSPTIFDPATRARDVSGTILALPFPGNITPTDRFNAKTSKLLQYYPVPNVAGAGLSLNYQAAESRRVDNDQFNTRIDFAESSNSNWFGRYSRSSEFQLTPSTFPHQGLKLDTTVQQVMLSNTRVLSPTLVNEFRFGYSRFLNGNLNESAYVRNIIGEIGGIEGLTIAPEYYGFPSISFAGFSGFGENSGAPFINRDHIFQWIDNVSVTRGKHSLRFGAEFRVDRYNTQGNQHSRGSFSFGGNSTQNPAARAGTGYGFADYLLGLPTVTDGAQRLGIAQLRSKSQVYYFDDTWKIRPNLTMNLGLRYENTPPYQDKHDGILNVDLPDLFDPARRPAISRSGQGNFYDGLDYRYNPAVQVVRDGRDRTMRRDNNDFAPRFGLAYSPTSRWTLRTGLGAFYAQDIGNAVFDLARNSALRFQDIARDDFPNLTFDRPYPTALAPGRIINLPYVFWTNRDRRTPYVLQFLFNVQRQLSNNTVLEVGYTGNVGHKLERMWIVNLALPGPGNIQDRRPYPEFSGLQATSVGIVNSNYHAASLQLQRRFSRGLTYLSSYTFSKSIDTGSSIREHNGDPPIPQDAYNTRGERGLSAFHELHRFVSSLLWEPPIGKGKQWLKAGGVPGYVLGEWQFGTILSVRSGSPYTLGYGTDSANVGWGGARPNAVLGISQIPSSGRDPQQFFNKAAFSAPAPFTYGMGRNNMIGPEQVSLDFSAMKRFLMRWEGHEVQFRFEAFNLPNRPNFGLPDYTFLSPSFGRISSLNTTMRELQFALKYVF
jgi:hypothetical protein